jgi:RNA recognition motif-containing protein
VKIDTLKQALTKVFQCYGPILDIIAKSSLKRKGQAFVVFDSEKSTLDAVEEMNGFELYGKVIKVAKAKTHSDETVKRKTADMFEEHKRKRLMLKGTHTGPEQLDHTNSSRFQASRRRRKGASQPNSRRREASRAQVRRCRGPRRIRTTKQNPLLAEHSSRRRRGRPHHHIRALRRIQGSAPRLG